MDHTYEASTVEMDNTGYKALQNQLMERQEDKHSRPEQENAQQPKQQKREYASKKHVFTKGDQSLELDDDFEIEIMADKRPMRLTLRELKDRAAGDIAVKNRMHSLAEEKKRVQNTFKEFATLAKTDPLGALEYISSKAKESDNDFEYNKYIEKLAEQAEKLGQMDEKERKAWDLEKKLQKANEDLSQKERQQAVVLRKQEMLSTYPEIGDSEFSQMVDAILSNDDLLHGVENEHDVMNKVEELIQETLTQRDIITVIHQINPAYAKDNQLIFSLSDQLRQNPDLDEEDVRDIIGALIPETRAPQRLSERDRDIRTLSSKQRQAAPMRVMQEQSSTPYDILKQKLLERSEEAKKTPKNKR